MTGRGESIGLPLLVAMATLVRIDIRGR